MFPDENGIVKVDIRQLERVEIHLEPDSRRFHSYLGYQVVGHELRPLPIGSTMDGGGGIFYWQPGVGFQGEYRFIFLQKTRLGVIETKHVIVKISGFGNR